MSYIKLIVEEWKSMAKKEKWIQKVVKPNERGLLHKQLGISTKERIPKTLVQKIVKTPIGKKIQNPTKTGKRTIKVTRLLKQRANFALNVGYGRYPRRK